MGEFTMKKPLNRDLIKLVQGLNYQALKSGNNWMMPVGKDIAAGSYVTVDGVVGRATAAIVGGTDAIVEGTNWEAEDDGALNSLKDSMQWKELWDKRTRAVGSNVNLPVEWKEIIVYESNANADINYYPIHIVKGVGDNQYILGYQSGYVTVAITDNETKLSIQANGFNGSGYTGYVFAVWR